MGSTPWKASRVYRWDGAFGDGVIVRVENPGRILNHADETVKLDVVEGKYIGSGSSRGMPCIFVHTRPEMHVRDEGFWDHELCILLQSKQMTVTTKTEEA